MSLLFAFAITGPKCRLTIKSGAHSLFATLWKLAPILMIILPSSGVILWRAHARPHSCCLRCSTSSSLLPRKDGCYRRSQKLSCMLSKKPSLTQCRVSLHFFGGQIARLHLHVFRRSLRRRQKVMRFGSGGKTLLRHGSPRRNMSVISAYVCVN